MTTYSPVTKPKHTLSPEARDAFESLWSSQQPANWDMSADPAAPPQEMLLDQLWVRESPDSENEYAGSPI